MKPTEEDEILERLRAHAIETQIEQGVFIVKMFALTVGCGAIGLFLLIAFCVKG